MRVICEDVAKVYPTVRGPVLALHGISFATRESEFVCIVGPSGCGKTTLLKVVAGLIAPSRGEVRYEGPRRGAPLNAMVFQDDSIFPWMTVLDNVAFPLELRGVPRQRRVETAEELIEPVAALDAQTKAVLQEELLTLWTRYQRTVLFVTHDIEEAVFMGDRVLVMSRNPGRMIAEVPVPFPRPREHALRNTSEFGAVKEQIWLMIRDEVKQALAGR